MKVLVGGPELVGEWCEDDSLHLFELDWTSSPRGVQECLSPMAASIEKGKTAENAHLVARTTRLTESV